MIPLPPVLLCAFTLAADTAGRSLPAEEATAVIAVAVPAQEDMAMREALNRLRGEALSVGFEVRFIHADRPDTPSAQLETLAPGPHTAAVVVFADTADVQTAEPVSRQLDVWFRDRSSGKTSVAHLGVSQEEMDRADVIIAVRAVDFIRARMFDTLAYRRAMAVRPPAAPLPAPPRPDRIFVAGGLAVLGALDGLAPSFQPYLEAGYQVRSWVRATVDAFGFGSRPQVQAAEGSLRADQHFVGLGLVFTRWHWRQFFPYGGLGGGAYHLGAEGIPKSGYQGHSMDAWSPGGRVSLGVAVVFSHRYFLDIAGSTLWLTQEPHLISVNTFVARTGRPCWIGTLLLGARFQ